MVNKKGLAQVVAVVILILLTLTAVTVVWSAINRLVLDRTEGTSSCFDVGFSEKVVFNNDYTCYNSSGNETQFSLSIGDIEISKIIVTISYSGASKSYSLTSENQTVSGLVNYPSRSINITMPSSNSGKTYIASGITAMPDFIRVAPAVGDKQCEITDEIYTFQDCSLFG